MRVMNRLSAAFGLFLAAFFVFIQAAIAQTCPTISNYGWSPTTVYEGQLSYFQFNIANSDGNGRLVCSGAFNFTIDPYTTTNFGNNYPNSTAGLGGQTFSCTLTARQSGCADVSASATLTILSKLNQTITFNNPGGQPTGIDINPGASSSSGLPVTYTFNTTSVCFNDFGSAYLLNPGVCSISADQAGNATYNAAPTVTQAFNVFVPVTSSIGQSTAVTLPGVAYTLSWNSDQATSCAVYSSRNGGAQTLVYTGTSGSQSVTPSLTGSYVWQNICQGNFGPYTSTLTHTVNAAPTASMSAPFNGQNYVTAINGADVTVTGSGSDSDGSISKMEVLDGGTVIATFNSTSSVNTSVALSLGSHSIQLRATDNQGATGLSTAAAITVTANVAPSVSLTTPANGATKAALAATTASFTVTGSASDSDGGVVKIEVLDGSTVIATYNQATIPANSTISLAIGSHSIKLRATDNLGATTLSAVSTVTVTTNVAPTATLSTPANNASAIALTGTPASFTVTGIAADSDGTVAKIEVLDGATVIATYNQASIPANSTISLAIGSHSIKLRATDDLGVTGLSAVSTVTVNADVVPTASLTSPANGASKAALTGTTASFTVTGSGADSDGTVTKLEVLDGATVIATYNGVATVPASSTVALAIGTHSLQLRATDNLTATGLSAVNTVTVTTNVAPTASLTTPANNASQTVLSGTNASFTVTGTAADSDGTVTKIEVLDGATVIATYNQATIPAMSTISLAIGSHSIKLRTTDDLGTTGLSSVATVTVVADLVPTATLTTPANNASQIVLAGTQATFTVTGTAADSDGTVTKIEVLDGATVIATYNQATIPAMSTISLAIGSHSITLRATDNLGATGASSVATVTVAADQVPTATLTAPANNASQIVLVGTNATFTVTGTAADSDGTVTKIEVLDGGSVIATYNAAAIPAMSSIALAIGSHALQLRATDNLGATGLSATANVTVAADQLPTASLTAPLDGTTIAVVPGGSATVAFAGSGADTDGTVSKVEVLDGGSVIATYNTAAIPASTTLTLAIGAHPLQLRATDNLGATGLSGFNNITVTSNNTAPTANLTAPLNAARFAVLAGGSAGVTITGGGGDFDGNVSQLQLLDNGAVIGTYSGAAVPAATSVSLAIGNHNLQLRATDNLGATGLSAAANIIVATDQAPSVGFTSPADGANYVVPANGSASVTVAGGGSDADGSVTKIEVLDGGTVIATYNAASIPAASTVTLAVGSHTLQLRATDNLGVVSLSTTATVNVNVAPTATLTSPGNGSSMKIAGGASAPVTVTGSGADGNGAVVKLEVLDGSTVVRTINAAVIPANTQVQLSTGTHSLQLRATDNLGTTGLSAVTSFTVAANTPPTASLTAPSNGATPAAGTGGSATVAITGTAVDSDGSIASLEVMVDNNSTYSVGTGSVSTTVSLPIGTHTIQLRATDDNQAVGLSNSATITVRANAAPTATISTSPTAPVVLHVTAGGTANVTVSGSGVDADGTVTQVEILDNGSLISGKSFSGASIPGGTSVTLAAGPHSLQVRATDNLSAQGVSTPVSVIINSRPTATITAPSTATMDATGIAAISVSGGSTNTGGGTIVSMDILDGGTLIASAPGTTISKTINLTSVGIHNLQVRVNDNLGGTGVSGTQAVTVAAYTPPAPVLTIASPVSGGSYRSGTAITLTSSVTGNRSAISSVTYYNGGTSIGSSSTYPYAVGWTAPAAGSYTITATATLTPTGSISSTNSASITVTASTAGALFTTGPSATSSGGNADASGYYTAGMSFGVVGANEPVIATPITVSTVCSDARYVLSVTLMEGGSAVSGATMNPVWALKHDSQGQMCNVTQGGTVTAPLAVGTHELYLRVLVDQGLSGTVNTDSQAFTVIVNGPPSATLTAQPTATALHSYSTANVQISGSGSDPDGTVTQLDLFDNGIQVSGATYSGSAIPPGTTVPLGVGSHSLQLRATDNTGAQSPLSTAVSVTVATNVAPTATIDANLNNKTYQASSDGTYSLTVTGSGADSDGTLTSLEVLVDGVSKANVLNATSINVPISLTARPQQAYAVQIRATDNFFIPGVSSTATVTITAYNSPAPPTANMDALSGGNSYTVGTSGSVTIPVTGSGSNGNGSVTTLDILDNDTGISSAFANTHNISTSVTLGVGTHSLAVRATDSANSMSYASNPIQVSVVAAAAPSVSIVTPANQVFFNISGSVALTANATANGGSITGVQYFDGATSLGSSSTPPYSVTWSNIGVGTHSVTAVATNSYGFTTTSQPVAITVNSATDGAQYLSVGASITTGAAPAGGTFPGGLDYSVIAVADGSRQPFVTHVDLMEGSNVLKSRAYTPVMSGGEPANVVRNGSLRADLPIGTHQLFLRTWTDGSPTDSGVYTIMVVLDLPPTVTFTSPVSGTIAPGTAISVAGTATPSAGSFLSKIELIDNSANGAVLGTWGATIPTMPAPGIVLSNGLHALQLRATDWLNAVGLSPNTVNVNVGTGVDATLTVSPPNTQVNVPYTVSWTSVSATSCAIDFSTDQANLQGDQWSPAPFQTDLNNSNGVSVTTTDPGVYTWRLTCQGPNGPAVKTATHSVGAVGNPPAANLTFDPATTTVGATGTAQVALSGSAKDNDGTVNKIELFVDTGAGFPATAYDTVTGAAANGFPGAPGASYTKTYTAVPGAYRFKLIATDNDGNAAPSDIITVDVSAANFKGAVSGIRSTVDPDPSHTDSYLPTLYGYACVIGNTTALPYKIYLNAGSKAGGLPLTMNANDGLANVATEVDNTDIQTKCGTVGTPHHFNFDLSPYSADHAGAPIFVEAIVNGVKTPIQCGAGNCVMPGSIRIGLTTPIDNDRYTDPAVVFMRAQIFNGKGPYDEISFSIDGGAAITAKPDTDVQNNAVFYAFNKTDATHPGLAARPAPYIIMAKVKKGGTVMYSVENRIYVDAASNVTLTMATPSTASGTIVGAGTQINLSAAVGGSAAGTVNAVKFYANGKLIATGSAAGMSWGASWTTFTPGHYSIVARAFDVDVNGKVRTVAQTKVATVLINNSGTAVAATPIPISVNVPYLGNADAGTLPGSLNVSKSGAANYGIEIAVPPGTAGLQPKLGLSYNSQGNNGPLGLGWTLGGMSSIHRCGQTIAQDGVNARISFALSDRLCLDGQRLALVNLPLSDANYWDNSAEYRTEVDSFARITAQGSSLATRTFKVESKDGRITFYGSSAVGVPSTTPSSTVQPVIGAVNSGVSAPQPTAKGSALSWAIDTINDRAGNYVKFSYTQDMTNGEHHVSFIRYGGVGLPSHAAVEFDYEARPDAWKKYMDEVRNDLRTRVNHIKTYYGSNLDGNVSASGTLVRDYALTYEQSPTSGRSMLNAVQACARNPQTTAMECMPSTTFAWGKPDSSKPPGFVSRGIWAGAPTMTTQDTLDIVNSSQKIAANHSEYFAFSDFENHGFTDVLEKRVSSPTLAGAPSPAIVVADKQREANALGRGVMQGQYRYFHNNGNGAAGGFTQYTYKLSTNENFVVLDVGDFNGDGAPDILVATASGTKICLSPLAQPGALGSTANPIVFACDPSRPTVGSNNVADSPYLADVVGDARSSIYSHYDDLLAGTPSGGATLCIQGSCVPDGNAPLMVLGFVYNPLGQPEIQAHDFVTFDSMVDFAGTGKANDVRWTKPHLVQYSIDGGTPVGGWHWDNLRPRVVITDFKVPGSTVNNGALSSYDYPIYTVSPTFGSNAGGPIPNTGGVPYIFDTPHPGAGLTADFNGSGYAGLAFGFLERVQNSILNYSRLETTLCLSTGRALDCGIRQKFSGAGKYQAVRGVGQFVGDGQPSILVETLNYPADGTLPAATGNVQMCRVMGDVAPAGNDLDANMQCDPWPGIYLTADTPNGFGVAQDKTLFMDLLGTGRTQAVQYHSGHVDESNNWVEDGRWEVFEPIDRAVTGQALDRIYQVTNGLGHTSRVEYADGVASGIVTRTAAGALSYPQRNNGGVGRLVKRLHVGNGYGNGTNIEHTVNYQYQDPATDLAGRGSLGFAKVISTDEQTGMVNTTVHRQAWPFTGMVLSNSTVHNGVTIASTQSHYCKLAISQAQGLGTVYAYLASSTVTKLDLDGSPLGTETQGGSVSCVDQSGNTVASAAQYDNWGNLLNSSTTATGSVTHPGATYTATTVNTMLSPDTTHWLVGLTSSTAITKSQTSDGLNVTRTKTYTYEPDFSGRLKTETVEPNDTTQSMNIVTIYSHNAFGLVSGKSLAWHDPYNGNSLTANETTTYDDNGRFIATVTNPLSQTETHVFNFGTGAQTSLTGPNGLTTTWTADGFGRVRVELRPDNNQANKYVKTCQGDCPPGAAVAEITDTLHGTDRISVPGIVYRDNAGHVLQTLTWGFDGSTTLAEKTYDGLGHLQNEYQPHFDFNSADLARTFSYDDMSRVTGVITYDENGANQSTTDYHGFTIVNTNAKSQVRTEYHDVHGKIEKVLDPNGHTTLFEYEPFGGLRQTTDPNGNVISVSFDTLGRKTQLNDPDLGVINYGIDPRGLVWKQESPKQRALSQYTRSEFDLLGRQTGRYESDLESHWEFDTATYGIGKLAEAYTGPSGNRDYRRIHSYDSLGRPNFTQTILSTRYFSATDYDAWGRVISNTYGNTTANGSGTVYESRYNGMGYLSQLQRGQLVLWQVREQDAQQNTTEVLLGNGLTEDRIYDTKANRLKGTVVQTVDQIIRLQEDYQFDALGSVLQRSQYWDPASQTPVGFIENFHYDVLNRLDSSTVAGQATQSFTYDNAGNITSKTGIGTYSYPGQGAGAVRPHAVQSITGLPGSFLYDVNGNLTNAPGRTASWTSFDMPATLTKGANSSTFVYGPEHQRTRQDRSDGVSIEYGDNQEIETDTSVRGWMAHTKTYFPYGVGFEVDDPTGSRLGGDYFIHTDRLGSPVGITDINGDLIERLGYDAWGRRRTMDGITPFDGTPYTNYENDGSGTIAGNYPEVFLLRRGFTGHEMLDELALIHMNGRVYDPLTGRFLTADPFVSDPLNGQNYNRYSYVLNNPTNVTDPTGFDPEKMYGLGVALWNPSPENAAIWADGERAAGNSGSVQGFAAGRSIIDLIKAPEFTAAAVTAAVTVVATAISKHAISKNADHQASKATETSGKPAQQAAAQQVAQQSKVESAKSEAKGAATKAEIAKGGGQTAENKSSGENARKSGVPDKSFVPNPDVATAYTRPSGAGPTAEQTASVQGKPCVDCGATTNKQVADHKVPLVVQHYQEGAVNVEQQRKVDAVQSHCPTCSNIQGGQLGAFSKAMKKIFGF